MLLTAFPAQLLTAAVLEGWGGMAWGCSVCSAGGKQPGMAIGSSFVRGNRGASMLWVCSARGLVFPSFSSNPTLPNQ